MKTKTMLAFAAAAVNSALSAAVPQIRYTAESPFDASGKRIESVWNKADTCIRFVEVLKYDVVMDKSEAQLLFDDKNLYASLTGFFDPKSERGDSKKSLFKNNNFEFLVKLDGGSAFHAAVDEFGRAYFAVNRGETKRSGASASVEKGNGSWTANLTIPLSALGVPAPKSDLKARVGIFRQNINVHERQTLYRTPYCQVSGFTPNRYDFTVSDNWAEMTLTRREGEPRRVEGPAMGYRVNLFANPEFNIPSRGWQLFRPTILQETMAMSGEWVLHSSGKGTVICAGVPSGYRPNTKYTLVVKARSFGAGAALRVVEQRRDASGKIREGVYPAGNMPVGPDMHEYFIRYTSSKWEDVWRLVFIKVDNGSDDTGIDIASIRMYEGDISSFEIRKRVRPGIEETVAGTEVPPPPSAYGRIHRPMRVLALVRSKYLLREPLDVFAGTGAKVDTLFAEGKDQDVYSTFDDVDAITKRIEKGEYDLYMAPRNGAEWVGKQLADKILVSVKKGAGLYLEQSKNLLHFKPVEKGGAYGKGRVFLARTATQYSVSPNGYLPGLKVSEYGKSLFPERKFLHPQVVVDAVRTAFGESAIPADAKTRTETFVYAGERHTATWTLDAKGQTLAWKHEATPVPVAGAKLGAFDDDGKTSTVAIEGDAAGMTLKWVFTDFSGRVLARGESPASAKVAFKVPRERLYTNYGGIKLRLSRGGAVVDQRGECIFVRDNDRKRLFTDFTPSMWPPECVFDDMPEVNRQLEDIGIRSSVIAPSGVDAYTQTLQSGIAVGGAWLCPMYPKTRKDNPNVIADSFNTKDWQGRYRKSARETTARRSEYGLFQHALCDEPRFSPGALGGGKAELDAHPENLAEYRKRMEAKYGTIAEYNRRHRTSHKSFADLDQALIADARASGNFAEFIEWRNFNCDRWCEAIRLISDAAHEADPDAPFSMCNTFGQTALQANDYWRLLTGAGLGMSQEYTSMVYFDRNPINCNDEVYRSFRPDMRVWGWTGYYYTAPRAKFMPWWCAAHRFGGFSWYAANSPSYNLVDPTTFAYTLNGRNLKASLEDSRLMDGLGKAFLKYDWAKRDIAICYSQDSMLLAFIRGPETKSREIAPKSPLHDYMFSRLEGQYLVEDLLYQHDYVAPQQVEKGKLSEYKVLLMPRINAMSDAEVAAVKAFLAKDGKVIADELPGGWDELGVRREKNPFAGVKGIVVTGRNFSDLEKDQRVSMLKMLAEFGARPVLKSPTIVDVFGREAMHFTDGVNDVYAVIRHPGRSQDEAEETFTFPRGGFVWDVLARKCLGCTDRVRTKIPNAWAAVYAVLPYEAKSVALSAPTKAKAGGVLGLDVRLEASGAAVGTHVFNVRFVPPSGECRFHFRRNVTAKGGVAHVGFPLALNDERGAWKVVAEDAFTGLRAERTVKVE